MLQRLGHLLVSMSSSCPLDDTAVGLRHHYNQSATGRRSDSQSVTGTYRTPLSGPTNHIFGTTVPSVSLSCILLPLWSPEFSHPLISILYLLCSSPFSGKRKKEKKVTLKYLKRKNESRYKCSSIPAHTNNMSLKTPRDDIAIM